MTIRYDEKGKYFSNIITKIKVRATIQTISHRIDGSIYLADRERPKDALNEPERFIAVTQATIYDHDGNSLYRSDFLAVNRNHIVWVIPYEEHEDVPGRMEHDAD